MHSAVIAIPLLSAFTYALSAMHFKRAMHQNVGPWRICFVSNLVMGSGFALLWLLRAESGGMPSLWQPALAGILFFSGQVFNFLAIDRGDVSVATPLLGVKVFLVAVFTTLLLREQVPVSWWLASGMTFSAVWLLRGGTHALRKRILPSILFALLSSASFALSDILVQRFAPACGLNRFLPLMFAVNAGLSFFLIPLFKGSLLKLPPSTWRWLLPGAVLFALSALGVLWTIASYGQATAVNIAYSARGIFSVLIVWMAGAHFGNQERHLGRTEMFKRLFAAALIVAAITLVVCFN